MSDLRKAAEMALEAMQTVIDCRPIGYETMAMTREQRLREKDQLEIDTYKALRQTQDAIQALRQALAQTEQVLTARVVVTVEKQKPAAWLIQYKNRHDIVWGSAPGLRSNDQILGMEPLYTAPPKREWVGLVEQDVHDAFQFTELVKQLSWDRERPEWCENFAAHIEAKLKEKNT